MSITDLMHAYWPHILIASIAWGFGAMVYTATKWALKRK